MKVEGEWRNMTLRRERCGRLRAALWHAATLVIVVGVALILVGSIR